MKATEITFDQIQIGAKNNTNLGMSCSYMQVEFGLSELEACWDGFAHTSDNYGLTFKSKKEIYLAFADALNNYIEHLDCPEGTSSYQTGLI